MKPNPTFHHVRRALFALLLGLTLAHSRAATLPNIVILYADDMGYGDLGANNPASKIPTPHLDKLAAGGMRFTDAHSSSGVCTPSRYALLTGRFHWRKFHGIVNSFEKSVFDDAEVTLPELLKTKGYRTACVGKWHLGWNWSDIQKPGAKPKDDAKGRNKVFGPDDFDWTKPVSGGPLSHGFDYYFGDDVPNFPPYAWFENDRVITVPSEPLKITPPTKEGSWEARPGPMTPGWDFYAVVPRITGKAVEWINQQRGKDGPFFLYAPFNSPHAPIVPTDEFTGKSQAGGFGDFMTQTDAEVGRILRAIEENGFADNTLVIFTADNGAEHYAYDRIRKFQHRSSGPLRGLKRDLYEGGHRVPFIVKWPGVVKPGSVSDALISQVDLMATLAAAAGAERGQDKILDKLALCMHTSVMPRQVRIQFPGATYHVMCRGDRREDIFREDGDREMMLATLAETVEKTGWKVHAWVLMGNHYHLLVQTPEPNLVKGMTWFQTTYTLRFNAKHRLRGHVFAGRYKAVLVEGEDPAYFTTLLDYLHLNPVRAGLVRRDRGEVLEAYRWSSWPGYLQPKLRQKWWEPSRAFAAWQLEDSAAGRAALRRRVERRMATESAAECGLSEIAGQSLQSALRRGWYFGKESFREWLLEKAGAQLGGHRKKRQNYVGPEIKAHGMAEAQRLLREGMIEQNLRTRDLAKLKKADPRKVAIAERIRRTTAVPLAWIAEQLYMGSPSNVSQACRRYLNP